MHLKLNNSNNIPISFSAFFILYALFQAVIVAENHINTNNYNILGLSKCYQYLKILDI